MKNDERKKGRQKVEKGEGGGGEVGEQRPVRYIYLISAVLGIVIISLGNIKESSANRIADVGRTRPNNPKEDNDHCTNGEHKAKNPPRERARRGG